MLSCSERIQLVTDILESDHEQRGLERMLARDAHGSLAASCQQFFRVNDPGIELEWAWFHTAMCKELEWVTAEYTAGRRASLVICVPPGSMKSMIVSVLWPCWWWLRAPEMRFLTFSNKDDLASRDSERMRAVVTDDWYCKIVRHLADMGVTPAWNLSKHQRAVRNFKNSVSGLRQTFSLTSKITGFRGCGLIIDDPHDVGDVLGTTEQVAAALGKARTLCDAKLPTRVLDYRRSFEVVVQQRVHESDVAGSRLASDSPFQRKVVFAAEFDPDDPYNHPDDPRTERGELLDPVRVPKPVLDDLRAKMEAVAPGQSEAQFNQRPQAAIGGMFLRKWMGQRYDFDFQRPPRPWDQVAVTIDCTFKESKKADFVSLQAWGRWRWQFYLGDEVHEKLSYTSLRDAVEDFIMKHRPSLILIEEKANGAALIDDLKGRFGGAIVPFVPDTHGDKVSRAAVTTVFWRAGNIWLPKPEIAPWVGDYCQELAGFPAALYDDRVDAMTQLLIFWQQMSVTTNFDAQAKAIEAIAEMLKGNATPTQTVPQASSELRERRKAKLKALGLG